MRHLSLSAVLLLAAATLATPGCATMYVTKNANFTRERASDIVAVDRAARAAIAADTHAAVPGTLLGSARVEVGRWLAGERDTQRWPTDAVSRSHRTGRTWIERHPVLTCTLVGAAAGAGMAAAVWGSEGAWVGTFTGGAAGAVVGAIVLK